MRDSKKASANLAAYDPKRGLDSRLLVFPRFSSIFLHVLARTLETCLLDRVSAFAPLPYIALPPGHMRGQRNSEVGQSRLSQALKQTRFQRSDEDVGEKKKRGEINTRASAGVVWSVYLISHLSLASHSSH